MQHLLKYTFENQPAPPPNSPKQLLPYYNPRHPSQLIPTRLPLNLRKKIASEATEQFVQAYTGNAVHTEKGNKIVHYKVESVCYKIEKRTPVFRELRGSYDLGYCRQSRTIESMTLKRSNIAINNNNSLTNACRKKNTALINQRILIRVSLHT